MGFKFGENVGQMKSLHPISIQPISNDGSPILWIIVILENPIITMSDLSTGFSKLFPIISRYDSLRHIAIDKDRAIHI